MLLTQNKGSPVPSSWPAVQPSSTFHKSSAEAFQLRLSHTRLTEQMRIYFNQPRLMLYVPNMHIKVCSYVTLSSVLHA